MSGRTRKRSAKATYIVIREGLPTNARSGIDLMLLLWNPLERETNVNLWQLHLASFSLLLSPPLPFTSVPSTQMKAYNPSSRALGIHANELTIHMK